MHITKTLLLTACCVALTMSHAPDMYGIINILYLKANPSMDGRISQENMTSVYIGLDVGNTGDLSRGEFVTGWMGVTGQSKEMANAYFDISDIDGNGQINEEDIETIFNRFDVDASGYISDDEFVGHYTAIYRAIPFVVLFKRVQDKQNVTGDLDKAQFETLFESLPGQVEGAMSRKQLHNAWVSQDFGTKMDADNVMTSLDTDRDDVISTKELGDRYNQFVAQSGHNKVGLKAMMKFYLVADIGKDTVIG